MALLRNREVQILGRADGEDVSPVYVVMYKDGERENVKLSELQITEDEHKNLTKANGERALSNVNIVKDKDLNEIREGQDKKKIEERQGKQKSNEPVAVRKVMVDPTEVNPVTPTKVK